MRLPIEKYAMVGNCRSAALVSHDGSIDWLCLPRFDSPACFARLLGNRENGFWRLSPVLPPRTTTRRYRGDSFILETDLENDEGLVRIFDFMPLVRDESGIPLVREVHCLRGRVRMRSEMLLRFEYGRIAPRVRLDRDGANAVAAPNAVALKSPVSLAIDDSGIHAEFTASEGQPLPFVMTWFPAHRNFPGFVGSHYSFIETAAFWQKWSERCTVSGLWRETIMRSLLVLKALAYPPTGAIAAAPTTSLPESLGEDRNWDYRYCWIRDAALAVRSLLASGYPEAARAWYEWMFRCTAGHPSQLQTMYGLMGERLLPECELDWLNGYARSRPVRIGNQAFGQFQLDVYGEIMNALYSAQTSGLDLAPDNWELQDSLVRYLETAWRDPDNSIWEDRGGRRHYTYSKIMAWVAVDRAIRSAERFGMPGPVDRWRRLRNQIHREVCARGFCRRRNSFVRAYDETELDAALLRIPLVGFLPAGDPRVVGTVKAIQEDLMRDGLVLRFANHEGAFIPCCFWLSEALALAGDHHTANEVFSRAISLRNDVGLLSEEYSYSHRQLAGNFPQALSHASLISCANVLAGQTSAS